MVIIEELDGKLIVENSLSFLEGTIFEVTNDGIVLLDSTHYTALTSLSGIDLTTEVNSRSYISTFYHYVLDTGDNTTQLRAYDLTKPLIKQVNFKEFNATARVGVNTTNTSIYKTETGFTIDKSSVPLCNGLLLSNRHSAN